MDTAAEHMEARSWLLQEDGSVLGLPLRIVGSAGFRAAPSVARIREAIGLPLERALGRRSHGGLTAGARPQASRN